MKPPTTATMTFTVAERDTAASVGSGILPALATPRLLAWFENATCAALEPELPEGSTSVGTRVVLEHRAGSAVGAVVEVSASTTHVDGRLHRFTLVARDVGADKVLATGELTRVVVDVESFLQRL